MLTLASLLDSRKKDQQTVVEYRSLYFLVNFGLMPNISVPISFLISPVLYNNHYSIRIEGPNQNNNTSVNCKITCNYPLLAQ